MWSKSHRFSCTTAASKSFTSTSSAQRSTRFTSLKSKWSATSPIASEQFSEKLEKQPHWDFSRILEVKEHMDAHLLEGADDDRFPIYPQRLVADVRKAVEGRGIIALDNGVYKIWFARNYQSPRTQHGTCWTTHWHRWGPDLPSAMASKMVHPDRSVTAICGDGGFMMNSQELETAVRLGLHIVVIILRDDAYGMIKWKQANLKMKELRVGFRQP